MKNTNYDSCINNSELTKAAICAFFPYFGIIGIHNFILKQYKRGLLHIIIVIVCCIPSILTNLLCNHNSNCLNNAFLASSSWNLSIISYILAIIEGVQILKSKKQIASGQYTTTQLDTIPTPTLQMSTNSSTNSNVSHHVDNMPSQENATKTNSTQPIISVITTIIPIIIWIYCFVYSNGNFSENGPGAIWWLIIMYYGSLGLPLAAISIKYGIEGLKTKYRWLAIISLLLKTAMIIAIATLLVVH